MFVAVSLPLDEVALSTVEGAGSKGMFDSPGQLCWPEQKPGCYEVYVPPLHPIL